MRKGQSTQEEILLMEAATHNETVSHILKDTSLQLAIEHVRKFVDTLGLYVADEDLCL